MVGWVLFAVPGELWCTAMAMIMSPVNCTNACQQGYTFNLLEPQGCKRPGMNSQSVRNHKHKDVLTTPTFNPSLICPSIRSSNTEGLGKQHVLNILRLEPHSGKVLTVAGTGSQSCPLHGSCRSCRFLCPTQDIHHISLLRR